MISRRSIIEACFALLFVRPTVVLQILNSMDERRKMALVKVRTGARTEWWTFYCASDNRNYWPMPDGGTVATILNKPTSLHRLEHIFGKRNSVMSCKQMSDFLMCPYSPELMKLHDEMKKAGTI